MTYLGIHCNLKTFKHFSKIPNVAINARGDVCVSWKEWSNYKQENQHGVVNNIYDFGRLWSYFERLRCYLGRLEFIGNLYRVFFSNLFLVICIFCTSINICILFGKKYYLCFTYLVIKLRTPLHLKKNKKPTKQTMSLFHFKATSMLSCWYRDRAVHSNITINYKKKIIILT